MPVAARPPGRDLSSARGGPVFEGLTALGRAAARQLNQVSGPSGRTTAP